MDEVEKTNLNLWENEPENISPLHGLSLYFTIKKNYKKAYFYAKQAHLISDKDYKVLMQLAFCAFNLSFFQESFDKFNQVLSMNIPDEDRKRAESIRDQNISHIIDDNVYYPFKEIESIKSTTNKNIIFTITTCKRYDLFHKTINSFLKNCQDYHKIDKWLCVDDNSSKDDRIKMQKLYPFFEFIFKGPEEKGHIESMNIIHDKIKDYKYQIHMEDDWLFFEKRDYLTESISVLETNQNYGQILFNVNYAERDKCRKIVGGIIKYHKNIRYLEHEHYSDKKEYDAFIQRNIGKSTQAYWPHYSLRPSVLKVSVLKEIGNYKCEQGHFEMNYAKKYVQAGYKSAFLDTICCYHIGKCTWEKGDNSYTLNGVNQFGNAAINNVIKEKTINNDDNWISVNDYDSFGNDIIFLSEVKGDIDVLKLVALNNPKCMGFNSLGYLKSSILPKKDWIDVSGKFKDFKMYIKKLDVTFTITTCKRLDHFIITMDDFLSKCSDHYLIKEWICIDDNSDEKDIAIMKKKYPFFRFIIKDISEKGHAKSMNILMNSVKTKYVIQYEDDWKLENNINIMDLYNFIIKDNILQIKLLNEHETPQYNNSQEFTQIKKYNPLNGNNLSLSVYSDLLEISKKYNTEIYNKLCKKEYNKDPYWWPGFTLNPSMYNMEILRKIGPFDIKKEFEYLYGVKVYYSDYPVFVYTKCRCLHLGTDVSAYDLNGEHRY